MQGALLSIPVWDLDAQCGTVPSPANANNASIPVHANTVPTPTKNSPLDGSFSQSVLPSPLLNWRPNLNVPPPVLPPPPSTPTHHNPSPVGVSPPGCHPSPCHNIHVQQKALLLAHQAAAVPVRQSTMSDFGSIDEYVDYLEREVGRVELVSFRVRLPNGQLALFESQPPMRRRSIHSDSGLRVETDMTCGDDVEDNALRNLSEWEEREAILQRQAMSMPDMRQYRHEVHAVTEPATLLADASFRSAATSFAAVAYNNGQMMPATVSSQIGAPMTPMTMSSGSGLQGLVAAASMSAQQSPLLNMRPPFAPPLCPSDVLPPTPTNNPVRGYGHAATCPATVSNATTPLSNNLLTPPDSPDFAEGSESPNSGCSTEADGDDDSASGQRTSLKPSLPGCQHSAYWKRLRHKKGTTHFLCVLCGCKWRRVSRDGEEE